MKCFCSFLFLFTPLCLYTGEKKLYKTKKKTATTHLSASVNDCGAFGGLNSVLCYYLKKNWA